MEVFRWLEAQPDVKPSSEESARRWFEFIILTSSIFRIVYVYFATQWRTYPHYKETASAHPIIHLVERQISALHAGQRGSIWLMLNEVGRGWYLWLLSTCKSWSYRIRNWENSENRKGTNVKKKQYSYLGIWLLKRLTDFCFFKHSLIP